MTPSQVLKQLFKLKEDYRNQGFKYTSEQQIEYNRLLQLRRERVKYFYENDLVFKGSTKKVDTTKQSKSTP